MKTIITIALVFFYTDYNVSEYVKDDDRTIKIPVIFHIISSGDQQVNDKVTYELILKEIEDLNKNYSASIDMSKLHEDNKVPIGKPKIQFYLADVIDNNKEKGVIRSIGSKKHRNHHAINSMETLNICVGNFGSVTQMSSPNNHKVHINYNNIGKGGNTVTHELGHYFGLWHVWGKSNCKKIKLFSDKDDNISDTPMQKNCTDLSRKKACPKELNKKNINCNNFMDYSSCRVMFSKEQAKKIRNSIRRDRPKMYDNSIN